MNLAFELHVSADGHAYLYDVGPDDKPVWVCNSPYRYAEQERLDGSCNQRNNRPLFMQDEARHWAGLGYHRFGQLLLNAVASRDDARLRVHQLLLALDGYWHAKPIKLSQQPDLPGNEETLVAAALWLRQGDLTLFTEQRPQSRYAF